MTVEALPRAADGSLAVFCANCDGMRPFEVDYQESAHGPLIAVHHISLFCKGCRALIAQHMSMSRQPWARRTPPRHTRRA